MERTLPGPFPLRTPGDTYFMYAWESEMCKFGFDPASLSPPDQRRGKSQKTKWMHGKEMPQGVFFRPSSEALCVEIQHAS